MIRSYDRYIYSWWDYKPTNITGGAPSCSYVSHFQRVFLLSGGSQLQFQLVLTQLLHWCWYQMTNRFTQKKNGWWFGTWIWFSIFLFSWECHHPNWRTKICFSGVFRLNHQPTTHTQHLLRCVKRNVCFCRSWGDSFSAPGSLAPPQGAGEDMGVVRVYSHGERGERYGWSVDAHISYMFPKRGAGWSYLNRVSQPYTLGLCRVVLQETFEQFWTSKSHPMVFPLISRRRRRGQHCVVRRGDAARNMAG